MVVLGKNKKKNSMVHMQLYCSEINTHGQRPNVLKVGLKV